LSSSGGGGGMPGSGESAPQRERRIVRDGYDVRDPAQVRSEVRRRREQVSQDEDIVQRLRQYMEMLRGKQGGPREFAMMEQLITQVRELKRRRVGPAPFRLADIAQGVLEEKKRLFFRSASSARPVTAPVGGGSRGGVRQRSQREIMAERSVARARHPRSFCNQLGATMWIGKDCVPSVSRSFGQGNANQKKERDFILDGEVAQRVGLQNFNVLEAAKSDSNLAK
jgi:hypothetical protein